MRHRRSPETASAAGREAPEAIRLSWMARHFEMSQWVPFPVELVFAFFANPHNLPHLMPPHLKLRVEDIRLTPPPPRPVAADASRRFQSVAAGTGSEILISLVPVPWFPRLSWTTRIVEFEWFSHFTDEQLRGPFAFFAIATASPPRAATRPKGPWSRIPWITRSPPASSARSPRPGSGASFTSRLRIASSACRRLLRPQRGRQPGEVEAEYLNCRSIARSSSQSSGDVR